MNKKKGNGFAKLLLKTVDWDKAPKAILVEQGNTETCYLKVGDTYTGVPKGTGKFGRVCFNSHNVVVEGDGAGFAFPPAGTNFLAQEVPGSRDRVESEPYHNAIQSAVSALIGTAQGEPLSREELIEMINEHVGYDWLSFVDGEATPEALAKCAATAVEAFVVDFCIAEGITPVVDIKKAVAHKLPRGNFQVVSGNWGPTSDGYARSVRLPYALREAAVKTGLTIKRVKKQRKSA